MKKELLYLAVAIFLGALGLSWLTHGTGVVTNDLGRNIYIPRDLTMPLQVKAAYNGRDIFFRYRWPARQPSIYHDMMKFEGGKWVRYGASVPGPQPQGIYEDRVTMLVDDGERAGVRTIRRLYCGRRPHALFHQRGQACRGEGPSLSRPKAEADRGSQVPAGNAQATSTTGPRWCRRTELAALRKAGYFLDFGIGGRTVPTQSMRRMTSICSSSAVGDAGRGPFTDNWDAEKKQPQIHARSRQDRPPSAAVGRPDAAQARLRRCLLHQRDYREALRGQFRMDRR